MDYHRDRRSPTPRVPNAQNRVYFYFLFYFIFSGPVSTNIMKSFFEILHQKSFKQYKYVNKTREIMMMIENINRYKGGALKGFR